jgi:hypothetical protein
LRVEHGSRPRTPITFSEPRSKDIAASKPDRSRATESTAPHTRPTRETALAARTRHAHDATANHLAHKLHASVQTKATEGTSAAEIPARDLSRDQALEELNRLRDQGAIDFTEEAGGQVRLEGEVHGVRILYDDERTLRDPVTPAIDPELAVGVARMAEFARERGVTEIEHGGFLGDDNHGPDNPHNQGRAVDIRAFRGVDPESGAAFEYRVNDWGREYRRDYDAFLERAIERSDRGGDWHARRTETLEAQYLSDHPDWDGDRAHRAAQRRATVERTEHVLDNLSAEEERELEEIRGRHSLELDGGARDDSDAERQKEIAFFQEMNAHLSEQFTVMINPDWSGNPRTAADHHNHYHVDLGTRGD